MKQGLIHIYTGDGKGKTSTALGLSMRASGRGMRVLWTSFLKDYDSGEFLNDLPFKVFEGEKVTKFWFSMTPEEKDALAHEHTHRLEEVFEMARGYDLLVLDEVIGSVEIGVISDMQLVNLLKQKPPELEVVLTGRNPSDALIDVADYVSELRKIKHPFDKNIPARKGIEF